MTEAPIAERNALERLHAAGELPCFPPVALTLLPLLAKDSVHIDEIAEVIQRDVALSAELLRVANSPIFSLSWQVRSVSHAAVVLGIDFVKSLSLTVSLRVFVKSAIRIGALRRCWRHSLACAMLAEQLARAAGTHPERAYAAGLLHDIGRLGLLAAFPAPYAELLQTAGGGAGNLLELERERFGMSHTEAGAWFAEKWRFPLDLQVVAEGHHEEPIAGAPDFELLDLVRVACRLADVTGFAVNDAPPDWTLERLRECLPERVRQRFEDNAEKLGTSIRVRIDGLG